MDKLTVDIVLLPPDDIQEKIIQINREFVNTHNDDIVLNKKTCLPHLTLAMGVLSIEDIPYVKETLVDIVNKWQNKELETLSSYKKRAWLKIRGVASLLDLHENLMRETLPFFCTDPTEEMFYGYERQQIDPRTIEYVKNFGNHHSLKKYEPHITIGHGPTNMMFEELVFYPEKLAICHLGNFCTCRKVLTKIDL